MKHRFFVACASATLVCGSVVGAASPAFAADDTKGVVFPAPVEVVFPPPKEILFSVGAVDNALVTRVESDAVITVLSGDVNFEVDSDQLTPRARQVLDSLAADWSKAKPSKVVITGHTDSVADDAHNLDLSKRRAKTVGDYLSSKVQGLQVTTDGKGETQPIGDNSTEEGKAQNRRVEIRAEK